MDIVRKKQIREWALLGMVGLMALVANLPHDALEKIGVEAGLVMAGLGLMGVLAMFLYVRFFFFFLYALLAIGANLPQQWAESLGLSQLPLLLALIAMVVLSLVNYAVKMLPSGLEPKKRKLNPEATKVLLNAIDRGNDSYVKSVLAMDFDLDTVDVAGMTPLMRAAQRGNLKVVQMLVKRGASSLVSGPTGKASDVALQHKFPAVTEFLKRAEEVHALEVARLEAAQSGGNAVVA
ncbi:MAG: ankyrin repeat domain-containing protein [Burkholderiaceae bacterium]|nr:ankyrin repeat domain-containing protein [Sulfuritalea sp.]MCF8176254.1 ankyrin repeat domain-containing protein [Burkholderiaceae bacterium]MCF8184401.1 ankyrin repeat domain-containing protein [Polynucleobacter sp.]